MKITAAKAGGTNKPMAVVIHSSPIPDINKRVAAMRQEFVSAGLPVYHTVARAANAINRYIEYSCHCGRKLNVSDGRL